MSWLLAGYANEAEVGEGIKVRDFTWMLTANLSLKSGLWKKA